MTERELNEVREIRSGYEAKQKSKLDELKALDKRAKLPAIIFAYTFGIIGALVLGFGMCMAMGVIFNSMVIGIIIGVVGIAMVSVNYPIYKGLLAIRIRKYAPKINELSEELIKA